MRLSALIVTGLAAFASAAATAAEVSDGLKSLTQKSEALHDPAESISASNAPLIIMAQGPIPASAPLAKILPFPFC